MTTFNTSSPVSPMLTADSLAAQPLRLAFRYEDSVAEVYGALERGTLAHADALRILGSLELASVGRETVGDVMLGEVVRGPNSPYPEDYHKTNCACGCGKLAIASMLEI